jgi:hypothetical protein
LIFELFSPKNGEKNSKFSLEKIRGYFILLIFNIGFEEAGSKFRHAFTLLYVFKVGTVQAFKIPSILDERTSLPNVE